MPLPVAFDPHGQIEVRAGREFAAHRRADRLRHLAPFADDVARWLGLSTRISRRIWDHFPSTTRLAIEWGSSSRTAVRSWARTSPATKKAAGTSRTTPSG
ncbi:MAG TPA: hypothetical protein VED84_06030 [Acidimicrobiales bacterium]|nr:hypothetical protein [Acidimicrobiales bacterium]